MFGSIDVKTRPLKLAYLVDPQSAKQVREAIRLSSTLWGGAYFPIIPLYKRMPDSWREEFLPTPSAKKVIIGYIEAYDPDVFVQLSKTVPSFINEIGLEIIKPNQIWQVLDEDKNLSPKFGLGIFELLNDIFEENFRFKAKYPVKVVFPKIPKDLSLFWTSLFGEIPSKLAPFLEKYYFNPLEITIPTFAPEDIKQLMDGKVLFPRRITQHGVTSYNRSGSRRNACVFFLDGSKVEDIIDFWNLRALGKAVIPVPKQLQMLPQLHEVVIEFLKAHRRPWTHNPKVCDHAHIIRARSRTMEEMQEYAKTLKIPRDPHDTSDDPYFALQHWYPRFWDEWARDKDGAVSDDIYGEEEGSVEIADTNDRRIQFRSLLPDFARKFGFHGEPRCANDISFRFYGADEYIAEVFLKSSGQAFVRAISGFTSFRGDWRVGKNGLVKLVRDNFNETREIPLSENVFFAWLEDIGWKSKLSPAGLLAKQIHKKLEGHLTTLTNEKLLGLLEHMNGGKVKRDGTPVKSNEINQERALAVGEVKSRLESTGYRGDLHNYLTERGVFKLGLRVQCPNCSRNSWFHLENVLDIFVCPRCLNSFQAVGNIENATWCYKTAGPFSVPNYADGAYTVLLTIDFLNDRRMPTMRITPALSFVAKTSAKKDIEADFGAFWQESMYGERREGLLFGESKTYGYFEKKDFDRMRYLANIFPGAVLIFSTLRKSLTSKEISGITRIAKSGRKYWKPERPINPVLILTGNELLNYSGPPYCWEDSLKKKFDNARGLLNICDATQQIYLNLPSWHTEWQKKWEKKRQRRRDK